MYENIECETLSVENIYWQSATIGIFLKKDSCDQMNGKVC